MELCLLLLTATAVGVASSGSSSGGGSGSSSGSGSAGGGLFPNLQCDPPTRRGRRLGQPKTVQLPSGCRKPSNGRGAALCDEPGDDYPWAAINNYLSKSSNFVKKRVENTLKASRISAPNTLRRRRTRSTDDVITIDDVRRDDVVTAVITGEKIRAKKHVDPPSGNKEGSGAGAEGTTTDQTSIGDNVDFVFAEDSVEGSGSEMTKTTADANVTDEDEDDIDVLVSFFLNNEPAYDVTKDALKDMLKFRRTFVTHSSGDDVLPPPTAATVVLTSPPTADPTSAAGSHSTYRQTTAAPQTNNAETDRTLGPRPAKRSEAEPTTTTLTSWDSPTDATDATDATEEQEDELMAAASEWHPVAAMPQALPLIARPPKIIHFNPPAFPARQRVTVVKATRLSPPLDDDEPALEDLSELVYASGAQRQAPEAEVVPPTARTTPLPPTTRPTPDPYTQPACAFREELRSPFHAMNTHNEWKTLINLPNYETYIHMEVCEKNETQGRCAEGCRCTQKYTIRNMPVYDTEDNGCDIIYMDKFLIASHCDCTCLPPGYTLFQKPPLPTTPLPEVVDLVGPLPEGILTERPTGARRGQVAKEEVTEVEEVVEEIEVKEKREGDTEEEEVDVEVVEVVEYVQEDKKAEDKALPSSGRPDKLKSESRPAVSGERQTAPQQPLSDVTQRVKPARAPLPPAIRRHVTVRPRPRRPTAGPQLPDDSPPTHLWKALTRRQTRPSPRNHLRGPPTAPPGLRRR